jgi:hypothetical protein
MVAAVADEYFLAVKNSARASGRRAQVPVPVPARAVAGAFAIGDAAALAIDPPYPLNAKPPTTTAVHNAAARDGLFRPAAVCLVISVTPLLVSCGQRVPSHVNRLSLGVVQ